MTTTAEDPMQWKTVPGRDALGDWQPDWCICCDRLFHLGDDKESQAKEDA